VASSISSQLVAADPERIDEVVWRALAQLGETSRVDRTYLITLEPEGTEIERAQEWCAPNVGPVVADLFGRADDVTRWWSARVLLGESIFIADVAALEPDDEPAAHLLRANGVGSLLLVPIVIDSVTRGAIGMTTVRRTYHFTDDIAAQLRLIGQTLINRLVRARAEQALAAATEELARRNAELERSNRDLEEFAYLASHDLKSPLLVIRGFLDLLGRQKADVLGEDGVTYVEAAARGAERMERLIDALLAFSRAGREPLEPRPVDLETVVHEVLADITVLLLDAGAEVSVSPLPTISGDPVQLAQVFQNLLTNAIKYARSQIPCRVAIAARRIEDEWEVSVTDNGIGIDPDDYARIFLMFVRLAPASDTPGSGIGLAICQRAVQAHGGRIWVEPAEEHGSRFVIALPISA
jgi:signal transduction histidine kinase